MSDPTLRRLKDSDLRNIQYVLGHSELEQLAIANKRVFMQPTILGLWLLSSSILIQWLHWWPTMHIAHGFWAYLKPVPAFGAIAIPIMLLVDWINRPYFEMLSQKRVREVSGDILDKKFEQDGSMFLVVESGSRIIGLVSVLVSSTSRESDATKASTCWGELRHLWVDEQYRRTLLQNTLIEHAVSQVKNVGIDTLLASISSLERYKMSALLNAGFKQVSVRVEDGFRLLQLRKVSLEKYLR